MVFTRVKKYERKVENRGIAIKYVMSGRLKLKVDFRAYTLEAGDFLLINDRQMVEYEISSQGEAVESLWVYLDTESMKDALDRMVRGMEGPVVIPFSMQQNCPEVYQQVYKAQEDPLGDYLIELGEAVKSGQMRQADQSVYQKLADRLLVSQWQVFEQIQRLTSAKLSTKMELYRRLCIAKAYIHQHLDEALDLDTLSQVACLSKYHFIRLFKEVFGQTPRQYLIALRLESARHMLVQSDKSFHEICQDVGLKDSSSFGRLFKRNYGATPHIYRRMHANQA
ncbi:MAG: AraC family transcriptional regulator [Bacteroidota bacterium]